MMSLCKNCPLRSTCVEPCDKVKRLLDSPDRGRLNATIIPGEAEKIDFVLDRADRLHPRSHAILYLYLRGGFTIQRIAEALGINRSNVLRRMQTSCKKIANMAQHRR